MITIRVFGLPQPGGSKRAFMRKGMRYPVVTDANPNAKSWKALVTEAAITQVRGNGTFPLTHPLDVTFKFYMPRNKGHYRTGKNAWQLKKSAPCCHAVKPDCSKLIRSTEDALTNIIWRDDAQIARQRGEKVYADKDEPIGAEIIVAILDRADAC